jgi:hypothetical protein
MRNLGREHVFATPECPENTRGAQIRRSSKALCEIFKEFEVAGLTNRLHRIPSMRPFNPAQRLMASSNTYANFPILGLAGALVFFDPDFTNMDPDPIEEPVGQPQARAQQPSLYQQRDFTAYEGLVKTMQERVAVGFNFPRFR